MGFIAYCIVFLFICFNCIVLALHIKDLKYSNCDTKYNYPVEAYDVNIQIDAPNITLSGSLTSALNISAPVQADLKLKRSVWGIWIEIPCEKGAGSCSYTDLCSFGVPADKPCPSQFVENSIPCRCPLLKGNYTMKPTTFSIPKMVKLDNILAGKYKGTITATANGTELSCYNFYFTLYDTVSVEANVILV